MLTTPLAHSMMRHCSRYLANRLVREGCSLRCFPMPSHPSLSHVPRFVSQMFSHPLRSAMYRPAANAPASLPSNENGPSLSFCLSLSLSEPRKTLIEDPHSLQPIRLCLHRQPNSNLSSTNWSLTNHIRYFHIRYVSDLIGHLKCVSHTSSF